MLLSNSCSFLLQNAFEITYFFWIWVRLFLRFGSIFCGTVVVCVKTLLIINLCAVRVWAEVLLPRQLWAYYCKSLPWVNFRCFCCFIIQKFLLIIDHFYLSIPLFTGLSSNLRAATSPFHSTPLYLRWTHIHIAYWHSITSKP